MVLERLAPYGLTRQGDGGGQWSSKCPCHEDAKPSLSVAVGRRLPAVAHCHACGAKNKEVWAALGLGPDEERRARREAGELPLASPKPNGPARDWEATQR